MSERLLLSLFGKQIHHIFARIISGAYNKRVIDSKAMHILMHESGFRCGRPGYEFAAIACDQTGKIVTEAHP